MIMTTMIRSVLRSMGQKPCPTIEEAQAMIDEFDVDGKSTLWAHTIKASAIKNAILVIAF